jgi:protein-S-isoprenylcysteine O-methyltransferase Ste14
MWENPRMVELWLVILLHQLVFQGMFVTKNIILSRKTSKQIRGNNKEANSSIAFFVVFICLALGLSIYSPSFGEIQLLNDGSAKILGIGLLFLNLMVSGASLLHLKDSWRVGILADQRTNLVTEGIYRFTRNPYFVSYLLMFAAYTVLLQNIMLLGLSLLGFSLIHKMIMKEEEYLYSRHGKTYLQYKTKVPRYIII